MPAYNAAATIEAVVRRTLPVLSPVLVVDDGSADDTAARAAAAGAEVVRHAGNQGKGFIVLHSPNAPKDIPWPTQIEIPV